jgi:hypothetical protein
VERVIDFHPAERRNRRCGVGVEIVHALLAVALVLLVQSSTSQGKGIEWPLVSPFCGQIKSKEPKTFPTNKAKVKLYRAKEKSLPCCESAEPLGIVKLSRGGWFDLRKLAAGQYWMVVSWDSAEVPVAVWFDGKDRSACNDRFSNIIEINPSTKSVEHSSIVSVD